MASSLVKRYLCLALIIFSGFVSYLVIAIILRIEVYNRSHEPLLYGFVQLRPKNFYLRQPRRILERICDDDACLQDKKINWTMVTFIKSKADYIRRREFLRKTWTSLSYVNGARFETVFLIGKTQDPYVTALLDEEEERYGDILQFDGPDDYDNMPYKVLAGMEWASEHLDKHALYASADDDFLINIHTLVESVKNIINESREATLNSTSYTNYRDLMPIMCMFIKGENEKPVRRPGWKWYVSFREYRQRTFPTYCHGGMYVMPLLKATNLWNESRTAPMLRLDDVWITGILRKRLNMSDHLVYKMPDLTKHFGTVNDVVMKKMQLEWDLMDIKHQKDVRCKCML
ncbi:beta-1,3-galactosyltransferase 5-like [Clavelina lepadiformis]|uniref:beta-1,3-galactosyltransferase 5-like n=1 Tax=Clavelina lepadiformis TaxID=159417 RepID=UPI0040435093